jgi:hypothetical protein
MDGALPPIKDDTRGAVGASPRDLHFGRRPIRRGDGLVIAGIRNASQEPSLAPQNKWISTPKCCNFVTASRKRKMFTSNPMA